MASSQQVELRAIDDAMLARLVQAAIHGAAPNEVTPPLGPSDSWTAARVKWLHAFHVDRRSGLDGPTSEATWAVVASGEVIGSVRLRRAGESALEVGIWLIRAARGQGFGRVVMAMIVDEAQALGAKRITATTTATNTAALNVMRDLGFTFSRERGTEVHAALPLA